MIVRTITYQRKKIKKKKPGIYSIKCIDTDFIYYGQSNNAPSRLLNHKSRMKNNICEIPKMLDDFETYPFESFVFKIVDIGPKMEIQKSRQEKESELIKQAGEKTYNTIVETVFQDLEERRIIKKEFGLYQILCLENNRVYFGQSSTLSNRLSKHLSNCGFGRFHRKELQADFNKYGREKFEFEIIEQGEKYENPLFRKQCEEQLITKNIDRIYSDVTSSIFSEVNKGKNNPFFGKTHTEEAKQKTGDANRRPNRKLGDMVELISTGDQYESQASAARLMSKKTGKDWDVERQKIKRDLNGTTQDRSFILWRRVTDKTFDPSRLIKELDEDYNL